MVFVYYFLSSPSNQMMTKKTKSFLKDIENQRYMGIITSFTIAEYLSVIKGALCNRKNGNVSPSDIATVKAQLEQFIDKMGIMLFDADTIANKNPVFSECESMVESSGVYKGKRDHKWHYLKGADALHLALAKSVKAEAIATFDDDFRGGGTAISAIMLSEAY
jgi:predicted nucleic acid-binding protein